MGALSLPSCPQLPPSGLEALSTWEVVQESWKLVPRPRGAWVGSGHAGFWRRQLKEVSGRGGVLEDGASQRAA